MTGITEFPTMHDVLVEGDNIKTFKVDSGSTGIKAGQVVTLTNNGTIDVNASASAMSVGVALYDGAADERIAIATLGSVVNVANADDTNVIIAGVEVTAGAEGGVIAAGSASGSYGVIGITLETIPANGIGKIMLNPHMLVI